MAASNCRWVSFNHNGIIHQTPMFNSSIDIHETGAMYNVNTNGMHGIVKTANDYVNIQHQTNILNLLIDAMEKNVSTHHILQILKQEIAQQITKIMIDNQDSKVAQALTITILDGVVTQILGRDLYSISKRECQEHKLL